MKHSLYLLLLLFLFAFPTSLIHAGEPSSQIDGPTESLTGNLVILRAPEDAGKSFLWTVIPNDTAGGMHYVGDGGRTLVFASRIGGTYHFILSTADGDNVHVFSHHLEYRDQLKPLPPVIDEEDDIGDWVKNHTRELVQGENFSRESKALADAFLQTSRLIEQGKIQTSEQARTTQRSLARKSLTAVTPDALSRWNAWESELARKLIFLEQLGELSTLPQIALTFRRIAGGLNGE